MTKEEVMAFLVKTETPTNQEMLELSLYCTSDKQKELVRTKEFYDWLSRNVENVMKFNEWRERERYSVG